MLPIKAISLTINTYDKQAITNPTAVYSTPLPGDVEKVVLAAKAKKFVSRYGGQCVVFARNFTNATSTDVSGMAKNVRTNTTTPKVGAIIKLNQSKWGHLGVIIAINGQNLTIIDSNYNLDGIVHIRQISTLDPKIMGYLVLD